MLDDDKKAKEVIAEARRKLEPIIKISDNFNRALDLRLKISQKRYDAILALEIFIEDHAKEGLTFSEIIQKFLETEGDRFLELKQCYNDEKRLMAVLVNAREETLSQLQEAISLLKRLKEDKQVVQVIKSAFKITTKEMERLFMVYIALTKEFYEYFDNIQKRIELEGIFISRLDKDTFARYIELIDLEQKKENDLTYKLEECEREIMKTLPKDVMVRFINKMGALLDGTLIAVGFSQFGIKSLYFLLGAFGVFTLTLTAAFKIYNPEYLEKRKEIIGRLKSIRKTLSRL